MDKPSGGKADAPNSESVKELKESISQMVKTFELTPKKSDHLADLSVSGYARCYYEFILRLKDFVTEKKR